MRARTHVAQLTCVRTDVARPASRTPPCRAPRVPHLPHSPHTPRRMPRASLHCITRPAPPRPARWPPPALLRCAPPQPRRARTRPCRHKCKWFRNRSRLRRNFLGIFARLWRANFYHFTDSLPSWALLPFYAKSRSLFTHFYRTLTPCRTENATSTVAAPGFPERLCLAFRCLFNILPPWEASCVLMQGRLPRNSDKYPCTPCFDSAGDGQQSRSGFKYVYPNGSGWQAKARIDGKLVLFGTGDTPEQAAALLSPPRCEPSPSRARRAAQAADSTTGTEQRR